MKRVSVAMLGCGVLSALASGACKEQEDTGTQDSAVRDDCEDERGDWEEVPLDRSFVSDDGRWAINAVHPWLYDGWVDMADFIVTRFFADCEGDECSNMIRILDHSPSEETWTRLDTLLRAAGFDPEDTVRGYTTQGVCYGQRTSGTEKWVVVERELLDGRGVRFRLELWQSQAAPDPEWLDLLDTFQVAYR
ncbi:MAG: hypothetical protein JXB39_02945 [Deltaproteobacteria bacterium]|nr:hypothetical protein [Deltaproteobacteria bacterium]